jgi:hypothetical protein
MTDPTWWTKEHQSTWDRVKAALRRDWEQTKADWSTTGHDLNQGVGDTLKQAAGKEAIPPGWEAVEPSYRYGVAARRHYAAEYPEWSPKLEKRLGDEWTTLKHESKWEDVKASVRYAWDHKEP